MGWIVERDAPGFRISEQPLHAELVRRTPIPNRERMIIETIVERRMEKTGLDLTTADPNNTPSLRAAFLAHTLKSIAPIDEQNKVLIKQAIDKDQPSWIY